VAASRPLAGGAQPAPAVVSRTADARDYGVVTTPLVMRQSDAMEAERERQRRRDAEDRADRERRARLDAEDRAYRAESNNGLSALDAVVLAGALNRPERVVVREEVVVRERPVYVPQPEVSLGNTTSFGSAPVYVPSDDPPSVGDTSSFDDPPVPDVDVSTGDTTSFDDSDT